MKIVMGTGPTLPTPSRDEASCNLWGLGRQLDRLQVTGLLGWRCKNLALGVREVRAFPFFLDEMFCFTVMFLWRRPCYSEQDDVLPGLRCCGSQGEWGIPALAGVSLPASFPLFNIFVGEVNRPDLAGFLLYNRQTDVCKEQALR